MTHVIRIDDDVWNWLKQNARPLEDTPNSVLRRIAGLDNRKITRQYIGKKQYMSKKRTNYGRNLKIEWNIPAQHVLYHKDGNYYNHLNKFPGALCDPYGYVIFDTEIDYNNSHYLQHGKQLHVPGGISSLPGYVKKRKKNMASHPKKE